MDKKRQCIKDGASVNLATKQEVGKLPLKGSFSFDYESSRVFVLLSTIIVANTAGAPLPPLTVGTDDAAVEGLSRTYVSVVPDASSFPCGVHAPDQIKLKQSNGP